MNSKHNNDIVAGHCSVHTYVHRFHHYHHHHHHHHHHYYYCYYYGWRSAWYCFIVAQFNAAMTGRIGRCRLCMS